MIRPLCVVAVLILVVGCSEAAAPAASDAGGDVRVAHPDAAADTCNHGSPDASVPAPHPPLPMLTSAGGPVLANPRFVPIFFQGDPFVSEVAQFTSELASSAYWKERAGEYGVGPAIASAPIVVAETPGPAVSNAQIEAWLAAKLDGTHPEFGNPDPSAIYVVYYPTTTLISHPTLGDSCSIAGFGGYHSAFSLSGKPYAFAAMARCKNTADGLAVITAHELFEAATDPFIGTAPAFNQIPGMWRGEIADACESDPTRVVAGISRPVPPMWSNAAQSRGAYPCVPNDDTVWFHTVADVPNGKLALEPGDHTSIDLVLFSDRPSEPWSFTVGSSERETTAVACRAEGRNGDRIRLDVDRSSFSTGAQITIRSTLGGRETVSQFFVGSP